MSPTRASLLFSFVEKYALVLLALAGSMIISRLLTPAEIGVYSVGAVLLGIAQVLRDFGAGQYLISERELGPGKLRAVLGVSFLFAWPLAALAAALSLPLAGFFREPRLAPVLQLLAFNFLLIPSSSVTLPMLRRPLRRDLRHQPELRAVQFHGVGAAGLARLRFHEPGLGLGRGHRGRAAGEPVAAPARAAVAACARRHRTRALLRHLCDRRHPDRLRRARRCCCGWPASSSSGTPCWMNST